MRILEHNETILKLRQYPLLLWLMGVVLIGTAVWALWVQWLPLAVRDWALLGVIVFFALLGCAFVLLIPMRTVVFDKTADCVMLQNKSVLRTVEKTFRLSQVQKVVTGTGREYDPSDRFVSRTHHIILVMKKEKQVQIAGGGKIQATRLYATAVVIQRFLFFNEEEGVGERP